jgi:hypothetical protein
MAEKSAGEVLIFLAAGVLFTKRRRTPPVRKNILKELKKMARKQGKMINHTPFIGRLLLVLGLTFSSLAFAGDKDVKKAPFAGLEAYYSCYGSGITERGRGLTSVGYPGRICSKCCDGAEVSVQWYQTTIRGRQIYCALFYNIGRNDDLQEAQAVYWDDWAGAYNALPGNPFPNCSDVTLRGSN